MLRLQCVLTLLDLAIETNRAIGLLAIVRNLAEVIEGVVAIVAARQQIVEIVPRRVEVLAVEVDDRHEAQCVGPARLLEHDLADLAQRVVGTVGHHVQHGKFDAGIRVRVEIVADDARRVVDGLVDLAVRQQGSRIHEPRAEVIGVEFDRPGQALQGMFDVTAAQREARDGPVCLR